MQVSLLCKTSHLILFILLWSELPCCLAFIRVHRDEPYIIYLIVASSIIMILFIFYFYLSCRRPVDRDLEYGNRKKRKDVGGGVAYPQVKKVPNGYIQAADDSRVIPALETKSSLCDNKNSNYQWTGRACDKSALSWFPPTEFTCPPPSIKRHWDDDTTAEQHNDVTTKLMEDHKPQMTTKTDENILPQVPPPIKQKSTR